MIPFLILGIVHRVLDFRRPHPKLPDFNDEVEIRVLRQAVDRLNAAATETRDNASAQIRHLHGLIKNGHDDG